MPKIDELLAERSALTRKLFFVRCGIGWVTTAALLLLGGKAVSAQAVVICLIGVPIALIAYDRIVLEDR